MREEETKSWQMWSAGSTWNGLRIMLWVLLGALFSLALFLKQQEWLAYIASGVTAITPAGKAVAEVRGRRSALSAAGNETEKA